jgi:hypothetical protein
VRSFLHFGGSVSEQFELVDMTSLVLTFKNPHSFNEMAARVRAAMNVGCDLTLHEIYDMGENRLIYLMIPFGSIEE